MAARSRSQRSRFSGTHAVQRRMTGGVGAGGDARDELSVHLYLDAATSAEGKCSAGSACRLRATSNTSRAGQPLKVVWLERRQRVPSRGRVRGSIPRSAPFRPLSAGPIAGSSRAVTSVLRWRRPPSDFRPDHLFCNPRFVRDPVGELVPGGRIGNPGRNGQHLAQELPPALRRARNRARRRPDRADTPDTAASRAVFHDTARAPFRLIKVSGSSPLSSTTTLTSNPSATSSSHDGPRRPDRPRRDRSSARLSS